MKKENYENGTTVYMVNGKKIIFNIDFKLPKKNMFKILQNVCLDAAPGVYCSNLSYKPKSVEDFILHLDKFFNQNSFYKVQFHSGNIMC